MSESEFILLLMIGPLVLVVIMAGLGFFRFTVGRRWNRHKAETVSKWEAEGIEFKRGPVGGQFGGLESMGEKGVIRGIGFIILTDRDLRVTRATPSAAWCIPFPQIKSVMIRPTFLGKTGKTPFIVVRFVEDGQADRLAFQVKAFEEWAKALSEAAQVSLKDLRGT
jgi:hypothetical protein